MTSVFALEQHNEMLFFRSHGVQIIPSIIDRKTCHFLLSRVKINISKAAKSMGVSMGDYLSAASRWASPSPILEGLMDPVKSSLSSLMEGILGSPVRLMKWNVICKNTYRFDPIPFHQDLTYSPQSPYQATAWLSLNNIVEDSGALEVCPGTQVSSLIPAVDFWSPDFKAIEMEGLKLPVRAGDVICFDSRVWHGSGPNLSRQDRYVIVTRWSAIDYLAPQLIPPIQPHEFGMWTCGDVTKSLLAHGAQKLLGENPMGFIGLIECWRLAIQKNILPFKVETSKALTALKNVKTLHLAYERHNGGDATGQIYKALWFSLLHPLKIELQTRE